MIIKLKALKIEHQLNVGIFVWDCGNFIKKIKKKYEVQFSTNPSQPVKYVIWVMDFTEFNNVFFK